MSPEALSGASPSPTPTEHPARAPFAAFIAFGTFWGAWGAALPALRTAADVSEGQLGVALLFVGLGALPSMAFTGRAIDRWGLRVASWMLTALAAAGVLIASTAHGMVALVVGMLLVGASSGASDVAVNTVAARAERASGRPLITRSHGLFSVGVVVASLATGAILGAGVSLRGIFALVAVAIVALAVAVAVWSRALNVVGPGDESDASAVGRPSTASGPALDRPVPTGPMIAVGLVAALAYAIENAHQSWGALMLTDVFVASPQLAAAAPAAFAATAAAARLGLAPLTRTHPRAVLIGGGALATVGSALLACAPTIVVALIGLVVAALGTATLFPTLLSQTLGDLEPSQQARATSKVSTTAYLGFLLGPAYVGLLADAFGLRVALGGVAALGVVFTLLAAPVSAWAARASAILGPADGVDVPTP